MLLVLSLISCVTQEQLNIESSLAKEREPEVIVFMELEDKEAPVSASIEQFEVEETATVAEELLEESAVQTLPIVGEGFTDFPKENQLEVPVADRVRFVNATSTQFHYLLLPLADKLDFDDILVGSLLEAQDSFELELVQWPYLQQVINENLSEALEIYVWTEDGSMLFHSWNPLTESWVVVLSREDFLE